MRVMLVSHSSAVDNFGGAELTLLHLIDKWRALRPEVEFMVVSRTPEGLLQPELEKRGLTHRSLDFDSWVLPLVRERPIDVILTARMDSWAVTRIAGWIKEFEPDLVVTNTIVSPWAALAARLVGVPHAWLIHEYGDLDHGLGFRIGRERTFEDIDTLSDLVVANSEAVRDHIARWITPEKLMIAYPAIDLLRVRELAKEPLEEPQTEGGALHAVMVGRLYSTKGQWRLLRAIGALKGEGVHITASLVGRADEKDLRDTLALVNELGIQGQVSIVNETRNPFAHIAAADVAVMASTCEAFGRVTVEYLALGKPVIAARSGANPELVADGETGWFFEADSIDDLARVLKNVVENPEEAQRRGVAARNSVDRRLANAYPVEELVTRLESVARSGPQAMARLPHVTREWLQFPLVVERYMREMNEVRIAAYRSNTWRLGRLLTIPIRAVAKIRATVQATFSGQRLGT